MKDGVHDYTINELCLNCAEDPHRRPSLRVRGVREEVRAEQQPAAAHADAHRREAVRMRGARLRKDLLRRLGTQVSLALNGIEK